MPDLSHNTHADPPSWGAGAWGRWRPTRERGVVVQHAPTIYFPLWEHRSYLPLLRWPVLSLRASV